MTDRLSRPLPSSAWERFCTEHPDDEDAQRLLRQAQDCEAHDDSGRDDLDD